MSMHPRHLDSREPEDVEDHEWETFTRRTNDPKLSWLEDCLLGAGIPARRHGSSSYHAPILQVPASDMDEAWAFLNDEDAEWGTVDDVPDNDARYVAFAPKGA
jgi:hypothetical protein